MFGADLMVCPVMELGQRNRTVYFPQGDTWVDPYTGKEYAGGTSECVDAPLEKIPVFVRKGGELSSSVFKA